MIISLLVFLHDGHVIWLLALANVEDQKCVWLWQ